MTSRNQIPGEAKDEREIKCVLTMIAAASESTEISQFAFDIRLSRYARKYNFFAAKKGMRPSSPFMTKVAAIFENHSNGREMSQAGRTELMTIAREELSHLRKIGN